MLTKLTSALILALLKAILVGFEKPLPNNVNQLSVDTKLMSVADVISLVRIYLGIYEAVPTNHGLWRDSIKVRKDKAPEVKKFLRDLEAVLTQVVGATSEGIGAFGFTLPAARTELTAEQKAARTQKILATRAARHTMGKRQKGKIHGDDSPPKTTT